MYLIERENNLDATDVWLVGREQMKKKVENRLYFDKKKKKIGGFFFV